MRRLKKVIKRAGGMCRPAMAIMRICIAASLVYALAALLLLICAGDFSRYTYGLYSAASKLCSMPQGLLLAGIIASVCVEDITTRRG